MKKSIKKTMIILSVFVILFGYIPAFAAQEGWIKNVDGSWSYNHDGGLFKNTWLQLNEGEWYYFKEDGKMATGWIELSDGWYYLYSNGAMACNTVIDGYKLNGSGQWIDDYGKVLKNENFNMINPSGIAPGEGELKINYDNIQIFRNGENVDVWMWMPNAGWYRDTVAIDVSKPKVDGLDDDLENGIPTSIVKNVYAYTVAALAPENHEYKISIEWKPRYRGTTVEIYKDNYRFGKADELIFSKEI